MSNEFLSEERMRRFTKSIVKESDRGCALAGTSFLDNDLEKLLRTKFLKENPKASNTDLDTLLKGARAPLLSFAARIRLAYVLGLISEGGKKALIAARDVRIPFAHDEGDVSIPKDAVDNMLEFPKKLYAIQKEFGTYEDVFAAFTTAVKKSNPKVSDLRIQMMFGFVALRSMFDIRLSELATAQSQSSSAQASSDAK